MTQVTFPAKIIFQTNKYSGYHEGEKGVSREQLSFAKIHKAINEGNIDVEIVGSWLNNEQEPVIIIRQK